MEAALAPPDSAPDSDRFTTIDLRDPVVIMALFDQLVTEAQVESLWLVWQLRHLPFRREPFWRLLLLLPNVEEHLLFEQAARVAGIEDAYINRHAAFTAIRNAKQELPRPVWRALAEVPVVPVQEQGYGRKSTSVILATEDPTHPRIMKLVEDSWQGAYELRYAPRKDLLALLEAEKNERLTASHRR